jgi:thiol-disulfide isomerase/thioredoxin
MRHDRVGLAAAVVALPLVALHVAYKRQPSPTELIMLSRHFESSLAWVGKMAPDFELELLDGGKFRLSEHVGREVMVLNFFTTWCGPCRTEMPELSRLADENKDKPFFMLGIDAGEKHELVTAYVRDLKLTFPVAIDDSGEVLKRLGVQSYPTTLFIGPDGRIQLYQNGMISNSAVAFSGFLESGLTELKAHSGISRDDYLAAAAHETYPTSPQSGSEDAPTLGGRAQSIAKDMDCPCGCDRKVGACSCRTSKQVKRRLARTNLDGKTDEEIVKDLDREFCMKGMD